MNINAKQLILNMLLASSPRELSVKEFTTVAALFDIEQNNVRVTLSRMVSEGLIKSSKRGSYQLIRQGDRLSRFIESWRLGERRFKPWQAQAWLCCRTIPDSASKAEAALKLLGFQPADRNFWVRPNNLVYSSQRIYEIMLQSGLPHSAQLLNTTHITPNTDKDWRSLWNTEKLNNLYTRQKSLLVKSQRSLSAMPLQQALAETFKTGQETIQILCNDPLLPTQWHNNNARSKLTNAMIRYEATGRQIWASHGESSA